MPKSRKGTKTMLHRSEEAKQSLVRSLARRASHAASKSHKKNVRTFIERFYANTAPEDILNTSPDDLLASGLSAWSHIQKRPGNKARVRVFNPSTLTKSKAWNCGHTVVEIVNDDMPFLVDSVTAALNDLNLTIHIVIHPVLNIRRDKSGQLTQILDIDAPTEGTVAESVMHVEISEQTLPERLRDIQQKLQSTLADVRAAVDDWRAMRVKVADVIAELDASHLPLARVDLDEAKSFLRWIEDNHFTFLGYREYAFSTKGKNARLQIEPKSGLGILRSTETTVFEGLQDQTQLPPDITDFIRKPSVLMVSKANTRSTVHRATHLDTIGIKKFDQRGQVVGERLFTGLFTSDVYNQAVKEIPVLRRKVDMIVSEAGFHPNSHNGKALLHILETLPRDELLQVGFDDLLKTSLGILHLQERQRVALFVHRDPYGRYISCLVYVPRDRFETKLRLKLQDILAEGFGGEVTAHYTQVSDSVLARLHILVKTVPGTKSPLSEHEVEEQLIAASRDWRDDLSQSLIEEYGEEKGFDLFRTYGDAFPTAYREQFDTSDGVSDIERANAALKSGKISLELYRPDTASDNELRFKLYHRGDPLPLSDALPMLENMGLKVIEEIPHFVEPRDADIGVWIHDFGLVMKSGAPVALDEVKDLFEEAFRRVWYGDIENDGFNNLVLGAGLSWREIVILRAYCKYLLQAKISFSQAYMEETLARNTGIARDIVALFECLFDPSTQTKKSAGEEKRLVKKIEEALEAVASLDEDRILQRFVNVVRSTLRTNYYQPDEDGGPKSYLSLKLDSQKIDDLPLPRPLVEIFLHSPRVDAVHLRGGKVARGGLRWSDRREDFRTEILGLMKSQMTKNAVIVPFGAKGGFVVKQPPESGGREAFLEEGIACYRTFMCGLLDITDNLRGGKVVPPKHVVRRDGDDPYLVVAADKGTATFSDIANGIAQEYGFWLDDAFASGGSVGYDHKAMGITARGAWESVKRHFRETGIDALTTDFTCVGVGDMSGDVFGNGLIYSKHTKLLAAFNHLHIFIDPDPDPATSFKERKRLFRLPRSSWSDYDTKLISKGGGIFERSAKSIKITPEMKKAFGLGAKDGMTPNDLLRAILMAEVDLLWFGGIGTYVKSTGENNVEVGDRTNDVLRINGNQVRAKIIGEGANLGITQLGRIEYALSGGRINTDFIDNSAGVGCSDHEVNIKILLGDAVASKKLTLKQRNKLLVDMTDDVSALVLMDNYRQSMALSNAQHQSVALADEHIHFIQALERRGSLDRAVEFLPEDEDLETRLAGGKGLTRPELSVLLAYAKIVLFEDVLESGLPDDPYLTDSLATYFPTLMQKRFRDLIPEHRLRREIIATYVSNTVVNRTGPSFITSLQERTGASPNAIAKAYLKCRVVFQIADLWSAVEALDNSVPAETQTEMHLEILELIKRGTQWFLHNGARDMPIGAALEAFQPPIAILHSKLDSILSPSLKVARDRKAGRYTQRQVPKELALRIANLDALAPACDIVQIAGGGSFPPAAVAKVFYGIGSQFGFDWIRATAETLADGDEWRKAAAFGIVEDLYAYQTDLTTRILDAAGGAEAAQAIIEVWSDARRHAVERVTNMVDDLKTAQNVNLTMLSVVNRELRALVNT
jgi:glutamate dehydrogenase